MRVIDFSVNIRLAAAVAVPLLVLCYVSGDKLLGELRHAQEIEHARQVVTDVGVVNELIGTLQVERGRTAGFIGSKGAVNGPEVTDARARTDTAAETFNALIAHITDRSGGVDSDLSETASQLNVLASTRQNISDFKFTGGQSFAFYTTTIDHLLDLTTHLSLQVKAGSLSSSLIAVTPLLEAGEFAGQERGRGAGAIGAKTFGEGGYYAYLSAAESQGALFDNFIDLQPPELAGGYEAAIAAADSADFMALRKALTVAGPEGDLSALNGADWFALASTRIGAINDLASAYLGEVHKRAEAEASAANLELLETGAFLGGALLVSLWLSFSLAKTVTRPLRWLARDMNRLTAGETDIQMIHSEGKDEIGQMGQAMKGYILEARERLERQRAHDLELADQQQRARAKMMSELQEAFGDVVDAAVAGEFSRRVSIDFPDQEIQNLAGSVNNLVETVDRGFSETGEVLSALARTDLTRRVTGTYEGAFDKLKSDTNAVADKLTEIVGQLKQTSHSLKTATGEILSGANDLSDRTTKQAAMIEQTSAAMEQLSSTVVHNARKADEASEKSRSVSQTAAEGGEVMRNANQAMEKITESSGKISNIIGLIDDIAFQTNLLALNASVEAARAGDAGKGFAVVAVEVRRLAQSAASASADVKALIEQSADQVSGGSRLVASAAEKLEEMLEAIRQNDGILEAIAHDNRAQVTAIDEVNVAVRQMDEMTQHNAALVEETNAAIEQTEAQASELDQIVDIFTLKPGTETLSKARAPARPAAKTASAARTYLSQGNAALKVDTDWSEF
jgi:methyl-accepting chemotaxis protein